MKFSFARLRISYALFHSLVLNELTSLYNIKDFVSGIIKVEPDGQGTRISPRGDRERSIDKSVR